MSEKILVINGPNLNLTGLRKPEIYGDVTLADINGQIEAYAKSKGLACEFFQSNHEGELIDRLHQARGRVLGVILNAGAYTHYSYALRDAIEAVELPVVEVHISNIFARDEFRSRSVLSEVCMGQISGFGAPGSYLLAVDALARLAGKGTTL